MTAVADRSTGVTTVTPPCARAAVTEMDLNTSGLITFSLLVSTLWSWRTVNLGIDAASIGSGNKSFVWNVSVSTQVELNQFIENVTMYANAKTSNFITLSLASGNYELDIVTLMNIGTNGSVIMESEGSRGSVEIICTAYSSDLEELRQRLNPLLRASLVLLDGLIFTGCPVPILMEEVSNVVIENCVFR